MQIIKIEGISSKYSLQCAKVIEAADMTDKCCICKTNWHIVGMLLVMMIGIIYLVTSKMKKSSFFKG